MLESDSLFCQRDTDFSTELVIGLSTPVFALASCPGKTFAAEETHHDMSLLPACGAKLGVRAESDECDSADDVAEQRRQQIAAEAMA